MRQSAAAERDRLLNRPHAARVEDLSDKEDSDDSDGKPEATGPPWKCALCPKARVAGRRPHLVLRADARCDARAVGAAADGADARPTPTVQSAFPDTRGAPVPRRMLTACLPLAPQRHTRAVARQQPGLPDPVFAAKGRFPAGYVNPDDESVRAVCWLSAALGSMRLRHAWLLSHNSRPHSLCASQEGETHAERLARVRKEHLRKTAALAAGKGKGRRAAQHERKRKRTSASGEAPAAADKPKAAAQQAKAKRKARPAE